MKNVYLAEQPTPAPVRKIWFTRKMFSAGLLALMLAIAVFPAEAGSVKRHVYSAPEFQTTSTLTFTAEADARVQEANPSTNYGRANYLLVNGTSNPDIESFIRFTVSGVTGSIQSARVRVYVTNDSSANAPAVYSVGNNWTETGITWNNRPARTSNILDNKGSTSKNSWIEYNVTSAITGNGTHTFVLAADSADSIRFSSREGNRPPQLIVTLNSAISTPAPTTAAPVTAISTATKTSTVIPSTASQTATLQSGAPLTFAPTADARVSELSPTTNYGTATTLMAGGISGERLNTYIRFTTSGINGSIQRVTLRVFCINNSTTNGPAVYLANSDWIESGTGGITWNNKPALLSGAMDNKMAIGVNTWVEYDITALVTGNGTYTFALVADSTDSVTFSSREGTTPPQLVVTLGSAGPTPPATQTPTTTKVSSPSPTSGSSGSVVLVGAGDISSCSRNQDELTAQLLDNIPGTVFTTGDNVYVDGTYTEYLNCYDPTWGRHTSRTKPSPGNHDYHTSGAAGYFQYFNNVPSYYAYDLGSWRIYSLNSEISASSTSAQVTWLQNDLAANPAQCVLAYWHKPRWSSGANHGDNLAMQTLWQILYNAGAELVVNGHEHHYERFAEMDGSGAAVSAGLREIVVGTGGAALYPFGTSKPASQIRNNTTYGVLKLTLRENSYDWEFVPIAGATFRDSGSSNCH